MTQDLIAEVGIDEGKLYIVPSSAEFPYIYREAMEVQWNPSVHRLSSPIPQAWKYPQWFDQLVRAAREQSCDFYVGESTKWINVLPSDKDAMICSLVRLQAESR